MPHPNPHDHRHHGLPLQAPAEETESRRDRGAGDRAEGEVRQRHPPEAEIVTARRRGKRNADVPDMTPEEFQRVDRRGAGRAFNAFPS
jgi:hypothetical protein